jgi:hypothetical protein
MSNPKELLRREETLLSKGEQTYPLHNWAPVIFLFFTGADPDEAARAVIANHAGTA